MSRELGQDLRPLPGATGQDRIHFDSQLLPSVVLISDLRLFQDPPLACDTFHARSNRSFGAAAEYRKDEGGQSRDAAYLYAQHSELGRIGSLHIIQACAQHCQICCGLFGPACPLGGCHCKILQQTIDRLQRILCRWFALLLPGTSLLVLISSTQSSSACTSSHEPL